jgi:hypothetical protein
VGACVDQFSGSVTQGEHYQKLSIGYLSTLYCLQLLVFFLALPSSSSSSLFLFRRQLDCKNAFKSDELLNAESEQKLQQRGRELKSFPPLPI